MITRSIIKLISLFSAGVGIIAILAGHNYGNAAEISLGHWMFWPSISLFVLTWLLEGFLSFTDMMSGGIEAN